MTVGELRAILDDLPDYYSVVLPSRASFAPALTVQRTHYIPSAVWIGTSQTPTNEYPENAILISPIDLCDPPV